MAVTVGNVPDETVLLVTETDKVAWTTFEGAEFTLNENAPIVARQLLAADDGFSIGDQVPWLTMTKRGTPVIPDVAINAAGIRDSRTAARGVLADLSPAKSPRRRRTDPWSIPPFRGPVSRSTPLWHACFQQPPQRRCHRALFHRHRH